VEQFLRFLLYGNGKHFDDAAGGYEQGGRVGVLLGLDSGQRLPPLLQERRAAWAWLSSGQCGWTSGGSSADVLQGWHCMAVRGCCRMPKLPSAIDMPPGAPTTNHNHPVG
jgi:hypothetical protein